MPRKHWDIIRLLDGRGYATNGSIHIYAPCLHNLYPLIRRYRHSAGTVTQHKDGRVTGYFSK